MFHVPIRGVLEWATVEDSGRLMANLCEDGLPEECEVPATPGREAADVCVSVMRNDFPNGVERKVLTEKLVSLYGWGVNNARVHISRSLKAGRLRSEDRCLYLNV